MGLPLLKILDTEEADAVLGHEMAHFSGEDTMWTRKINPLLTRLEIYLAHLSENPLALPVYHFLLFFWKVYQFSLGRMSRLREFRADRIGAETSSSRSLAKSLVKIASYCEYRFKTEEKIFLEEEVASRPDIAQRLEQGFPEHLSNFVASPESMEAETSHPFDTHPPLADRLEAAGHSMTEICNDPELLRPPTHSWRDTISEADALEQDLWNKEEKMLMEARETHRAMILIPATDEEHQLVAKHFPEKTFTSSKGQMVVVNHDGISLPETPQPIRFKNIALFEFDDSMGQNQLKLTHRPEGVDETQTLKFKPQKFKNPDENLIETIELYYGRHSHAEAMAEEEEEA